MTQGIDSSRVPTERLLETLRSAGEPTRLRILAALAARELTVSEICYVLDQSQPRTSRHLKLLVDAGLLSRHAEGASAFFRRANTGPGRALLDAIEPLIDYDDPELCRDRKRLAEIEQTRAEAAETYFNALAADWDRVRDRHVADELVEAMLVREIEGQHFGTLLDVGTGTGRMLEVFAEHVEHGIGIDISVPMLSMARARLDDAGISNYSVRKGSAYALDRESGSVDVVVLHHVLHFLDDPERAIAEASRVLNDSGQLLIVDFAPHGIEELRSEYGHRRLGYATDEVIEWCTNAGISDVVDIDLKPKRKSATDEPLITTIWTATASNTHASQRLDTAS